MKKVFLATSAIAAGIVGAAGTANALTSSFTASIEVRDALGMSQNTQMNFGTMQTAGADRVVHLTQAGANGTGTTATMIDTAAMAAGSYKITGSANNTININGTDGGTANFTFTNINCKYDGGSETDIIASTISTAAAPTSAGKNLVCGAKLTVAAAVTDGSYTPALDITVAYD